MPENYELGPDAVQDLAELVRAWKRGEFRPVSSPAPRRNVGGYVPMYYRLLTDETGGEYTMRKQTWKQATGELADVADDADPEYNRVVRGHDFRGRDGAPTDADGEEGDGLIVHGWKVFVNGEWLTLIDVGDPSFTKVFYAYLMTACGYWIAVNKTGHVLGTAYFVTGEGWKWDSPSEWGIPHPDVVPEPEWTPGIWI